MYQPSFVAFSRHKTLFVRRLAYLFLRRGSNERRDPYPGCRYPAAPILFVA